MEGEFEFFDEDDVANAEPEQHDIRVSGLRSLFQRECCGGGGVIGYSENDADVFGCFGFRCFAGGFFCPSVFGVVDSEEVVPEDCFFEKSEAEGGFDQAVEHFGCVEVGGVFREGFQYLLGGGEGFFVAQIKACRLHGVRDELGSDEVQFRLRVLRVGGGGKFIDERLEGFVRFCHVDLASFDVLYVLEVDEPFQVEGVGERGRRGVG